MYVPTSLSNLRESGWTENELDSERTYAEEVKHTGRVVSGPKDGPYDTVHEVIVTRTYTGQYRTHNTYPLEKE